MLIEVGAIDEVFNVTQVRDVSCNQGGFPVPEHRVGAVTIPAAHARLQVDVELACSDRRTGSTRRIIGEVKRPAPGTELAEINLHQVLPAVFGSQVAYPGVPVSACVVAAHAFDAATVYELTATCGSRRVDDCTVRAASRVIVDNLSPRAGLPSPFASQLRLGV